MTIPFTLPLPPSANNMFVNVAGRGRVKAVHYKAWEYEATWAMAGYTEQNPDRKAKWELTATYVMPDWRRRDLDNKIKATVDFLAWRFGLDDNLLVAIAVVKAVTKGEHYVTGEVRIG